MHRVRSVCAISPVNISNNPRLVKELRTLDLLGLKSSAIVGVHNGPGTSFDSTVGDSLSSEILGVPYGPGAGFSRRFSQVPGRLASRALLSVCPFDIPALVERGIHDSTPGLTRAAISHKADLYIAHYVAALPAAARAAAAHGSRYAFDAEDFHIGDLSDAPENRLQKRLVQAIEAKYLPGAAFITAASPLIADAYEATYGIARPTVLLNVFPRARGLAGPTPRGSATPGPSLYWFSRTIGPGRGLETALQAIARSESRPHLYLRGWPEPGFRAMLLELAGRLGVADRLHFLDLVSPFELERLGEKYDLGLCGELDNTVGRDLALTNKLFSYLTSGLPVMASSIAAHREIGPLIGDAMAIFDSKDAAALAATLDGYLLNPTRLMAAREHAWHLGQERFSWEREQESLASVLGRSVRDLKVAVNA